MIRLFKLTCKYCACVKFAQALAILILILPAALVLAAPVLQSASNVWYTQIGQWHLMQKDGIFEKSFFFHDSRVDGARSGQATANLRYNFCFENIRRYEVRLVLGSYPAKAGLLVQNKQITYYFLIKKAGAIEKISACDSIQICRFKENRINSLFNSAATVLDTANLTLSVKADSLLFNASGTVASISKPTDFPEPAFVGFECPQGSVKIFNIKIDARNATVEETFTKAALVNLHLDRMFEKSVKKDK